MYACISCILACTWFLSSRKRVSVSALSWIVKIPEELGRDLATHNCNSCILHLHLSPICLTQKGLLEPRPLHNLVSNCIPYSAFRISHLLILLTYFCMVFKCHSSLLKLFIVRTHTLNICCFCPYPSTHTHTHCPLAPLTLYSSLVCFYPATRFDHCSVPHIATLTNILEFLTPQTSFII